MYGQKGNKVNKGGQHMIAVETISQYMYVWTSWHKGFKKEGKFTQEGPMELKSLREQLTLLVKGQRQK